MVARLRESGFPAPVAVLTSEGLPFQVLEQDIYEVWEFIDGKPYNPGHPSHLEAAAQTLAQFHMCIDGFESPALCVAGPLYSPGRIRGVLGRLRQAWEIRPGSDLAQVASRLETGIGALQERFDKHGLLPHLIVHGDFHGGNLLFCDARVVGLVDYDKASWQPRIAELAEALVYFASPVEAHMHHVVYPGFLDEGRFAHFAGIYARTAGMLASEAQALPDYINCVWLYWSLRRLLEGAPKQSEHVQLALHEVLALGTWVTVNREKMIQMGVEYDRGSNL
jgi:Ser/Thr protein kinase RdoA (MazF antagonist)